MTISRRDIVLGSATMALVGVAGCPALAAVPSDDSVEALARRLVALINDPAADAAALATVLSPNSLRNRPAADWLAEFARLRAASGGMTFQALERGRGEEHVVVVRPRVGPDEARLTAFVRADVPGVFSGVFALPRPALYPHALVDRPVPRRDLAEAIRQRVRWSATRGDFSGALQVLAPDGAALVEMAVGRSEGRPLTPDHRFHLGSADKSFTALMVGRMVESGRLHWNTRLAEVLPDYPNAEAARSITVEQLISHRAGLGGLFERPRWERGRRYDRVAELLPVFAAEPLAFAPGSQARYSNEGFVVLGAVLEKVDGRPYWDQLAERIYRPAGMTRSAHLTAADRVADRAIGYRYADDDDLGLRGRQSAADFTGWRGNSCGGGYSTVADMCRYLAGLRAGHLASAGLVEKLSSPFAGGLRDYGMGFQSMTVAGRSIRGHSGGGPHSGIDGASFIVWETGWAFSLLGNYDAPFARDLARDLTAMLAAQA